jgi:hypothetical protein
MSDHLKGYDLIVSASRYEAEPSAKAVLCWLAYFADRKTRSCFPCQKQLANLTGRSERRVRSALKMLEDDKVISRRKQRIGNRQGSDLITLSKKLFQADTVSGSKTGFQADKSTSLRRTQCPGNYKEGKSAPADAETAPKTNTIMRP